MGYHGGKSVNFLGGSASFGKRGGRREKKKKGGGTKQTPRISAIAGRKKTCFSKQPRSVCPKPARQTVTKEERSEGRSGEGGKQGCQKTVCLESRRPIVTRSAFLSEWALGKKKKNELVTDSCKNVPPGRIRTASPRRGGEMEEGKCC